MERAAALQNDKNAILVGEWRKQHARYAIAEISNTMNAGDDLLRALRPLVSRQYKPSLTRA